MSREAAALAIVEAALAIEDPAGRAALVAARCGDDAALRARVEQLLSFDAAGFTLLPTGGFVPPLSAGDAVPDVIPDRIGPYRVTGDVARGGMGAVVRAERDDGLFEQTVAIKLIHADLSSARARARFAAERRILARLRHPGIVRILDGGEVDGRPWLAMDFVDGAPVTEALDRRDATPAERLDAFEAVCEAVAHAHRQMVIHADLKPSNVLLTTDGQVQLLDFGIARLIVGLDMDESGDPYPLTKGYAAPERAVGSLPTVASDIFSLGVLLLAMLGKAIPGPGVDLVAGTQLPTGQLDGDLAAIAACALADDPAARYPDVPALLADLRRHRSWRPVVARGRTGAGYRAGRFVRRHARLLGWSAAAVLLLLAAGMVSTAAWVRADRAAQDAAARFADARRSARYLLFDLMPRLENAPDALRVRVETAQAAERSLSRLAATPQATPEVRLEAATGLWRLAQYQARPGHPHLNQPDRAEANLDRAERLALTVSGPAARVLLAHIRIDRTWLATMAQADLPDAEKRARAMLASVAAARADAPDLEAQAHYVLADLRGWQGRFEEEQAIAQAALARMPAPQSRDDHVMQAHLLSRIAESLYYRERPAEALAPYERALATIRAARARWPDDNFLRLRQSVAEWEIGSTLLDLRRTTQALDMLSASVANAERGHAFDRADLDARRIVRVASSARAQALAQAGRTDEAIVQIDRVIAADAARLKAEPGSALAARDYAYDRTLPGEALDLAGRREAACAADKEAVAAFDALKARALLTPFDMANNRKLVSARIARNCPAVTPPAAGR